MSLTVQQFIKNLTLKERAALALETDSSTGYLNRIASMQRLCSSELAHSFWTSNINRKLPKYMRFTKQDFEIHRKAKLEERKLRSV